MQCDDRTKFIFQFRKLLSLLFQNIEQFGRNALFFAVGFNLQIHPGYEMVVTLRPNELGEFGVVCNEFCGIGHHNMVGKIYVVE